MGRTCSSFLGYYFLGLAAYDVAELARFSIEKITSGVIMDDIPSFRQVLSLDGVCENVEIVLQSKVLHMCKFPLTLDLDTLQGAVFRGLLEDVASSSKQFVVVKFYFANPEVKYADIPQEIKVGEKLEGLVSMMQLIGEIDYSGFARLATAGADLSGLEGPGAVFEYIDGPSVAELYFERLEKLKFAAGDEYPSLNDPGMKAWTACMTYQLILSHVSLLARGLFNLDAHANNFKTDSARKFRVDSAGVTSNGFECELTKMIDFGGVLEITANEVPVALAESLFSRRNTGAFGLYYFANSFDGLSDLWVIEPVPALLAEIMRMDPDYEKYLMSAMYHEISAESVTGEFPAVAGDAPETYIWLFYLFQSLRQPEYNFFSSMSDLIKEQDMRLRPMEQEQSLTDYEGEEFATSDEQKNEKNTVVVNQHV